MDVPVRRDRCDFEEDVGLPWRTPGERSPGREDAFGRLEKAHAAQVAADVTRAAQFQNRCLTASVPPNGASREKAHHAVGTHKAEVPPIEENLLVPHLHDLGKKSVTRLVVQRCREIDNPHQSSPS